MRRFLYELKKLYALVFRYPVARLSAAAPDYDHYWEEKRGAHLGALSHWQRARADFALAYLSSREGASLVDVGCGDGSVLRYLKEKGNVSRATGVDVSDVALAKAREGGIATVRADIADPAARASIPDADYLIMFEVLEHLPDSEACLSEMLHKSRRGVFFSFPNTGFYAHRLRLLFGKFPLQWKTHPGEHLRFWTYADLQWWLAAQGYREARIRTYEGVPVLNRLWPSLFAAGLFVYLPKDA